MKWVSPLTADARFLDDTAIFDKESRWTWRQIHRASLDLTSHLGEGQAVCNLCQSRVAFLVVFLAALRRKCHLLQPSSRGGVDSIRLIQPTTNTLILVDDQKQLKPEWQPYARCLVYKPNVKHWSANDNDNKALVWEPD